MAVSQSVIKKLHDHFSKHAISICNDGEEVAPQCFFIGLDDDGNITGTEPLPPQLLAYFFGSVNGKDAFAIFMRDMLDDTHGVHQTAKVAFGFATKVIVQINEAWVRLGDKDSIDEPPPSQHPDRQEALMVSLHTRQGTTGNMHKIMDKPKRHAVFRELRFDVQVYGRFSMQDAFGFKDNPVQ